MSETTPRLALKKPVHGEMGWDSPLRQTIDIIDSTVAAITDVSNAVAAHNSSPTAHSAGTITYLQLAAEPDTIVFGAITRNANGAVTTAAVIWPDNTPGTYTATVLSTQFPGAVDAYTITYGSPVIHTYTQPTVTRNTLGAVTNRPQITVV